MASALAFQIRRSTKITCGRRSAGQSLLLSLRKASMRLLCCGSSPRNHSKRQTTKHPDKPADEELAHSGAYITFMPDLVMVEIFKFLQGPDLGRACRVCKSWRRILCITWLWRDVEAKFNPRFLRIPTLENMKARKIRQFNLATSNLPLCLKNLEYLFPEMRKLTIREYGQLYGLEQMNLDPLGLELLTQLDLTVKTQYSQLYFDALFKQLPSLKDLTFRGRFGDVFLVIHRDFLVSLERLHLSSDDITNSGIRELTEVDENWESPPELRLKHLKLSHCRRLTDSTLRHVVRGFPDLDTFEVARCDAITVFHLEFLVEVDHDVENMTIIVSTMGRPSLLVIADGEPHRLELRIPLLSAEGFDNVVWLCIHFPTLRHVSFHGFTLSEDYVLVVVEELPQLQTIGLFVLNKRTLAQIHEAKPSLKVMRTTY